MEESFAARLGLNALNGRFGLEYQQAMAQAITGPIPVLLVFLFARRRFV